MRNCCESDLVCGELVVLRKLSIAATLVSLVPVLPGTLIMISFLAVDPKGKHSQRNAGLPYKDGYMHYK